MTPPILTAIIIIFIVWLNYEIKKNSRQSKNDEEEFWNQEKDSNLSRRADISSLNYITITTDRLPMADHPNQTVNSYRDMILKLSGKKVVNLSGFTNTELKLKYGIANLKLLTECDNTYTTLVSILQKWAERLNDLGDLDSCASVLEYAVSCYTDVANSYKLLANIYSKMNYPEKIDDIIQVIPKTKIADKEKLIDELTWIKNS